MLSAVPLLILLIGGPTAPDADIKEIEATSKVPLIFERDGDIDVETWGGDYTIPVVKPLGPHEIDRARRLLAKATAKYPAGFLKKRLKRIYVCASLSVDGFEYGATYDDRTLYIVDGGISEGFDDRFLEQSFHHELSSVLMHENESIFPEDAWVATNPKTFVYKGYDAVYNDKKSEIDWEEQRPAWLRMGFVKRYSLTSVEEDLNTVAESMFAGGTGFWKQADQNPRLLKKTRVAISFYKLLNPWFPESRFRSFKG